MHRSWAERHNPGCYFNKEIQKFEELVSSTATGMEVSDPRDCIYALVGLNKDPFIRIDPDYRLLIEEVIVSTAKEIILGSQRLGIFEHLCRDGERNEWRPLTRTSPTWVPNFLAEEHLRPFLKFPASTGRSSNAYMYAHSGECNAKTLTVHGKILDRVHTRIQLRIPLMYVSYIRDPKFDFLRYFSLATAAWELSRQVYPKPTKKSLFEALLAQGNCEQERVLALLAKAEQQNFNIPGLLSLVVGCYHKKIETKDPSLVLTEPQGVLLQEATSAIYTAAVNRHLFVTEQGRLALGCTLEPGDDICILHGCSNPVALRAAGYGRYHVQETCFLEDWMDPWSRNKVDWEEHEADEFILI